MSLFFDADWFDARLRERVLTRAQLAEAAGISASELQELYCNQRSPTAEELQGFSRALDTDLLEVSLKAGVAARPASQDADAGARIASIEARLDAIDTWIAELESRKRA